MMRETCTLPQGMRSCEKNCAGCGWDEIELAKRNASPLLTDTIKVDGKYVTVKRIHVKQKRKAHTA